MTVAPSPDIFKAYDIRGLYPEQIDGDLAERIGRAFAHVLGKLAGAFAESRERAGESISRSPLEETPHRLAAPPIVTSAAQASEGE